MASNASQERQLAPAAIDHQVFRLSATWVEIVLDHAVSRFDLHLQVSWWIRRGDGFLSRHMVSPPETGINVIIHQRCLPK